MQISFTDFLEKCVWLSGKGVDKFGEKVYKFFHRQRNSMEVALQIKEMTIIDEDGPNIVLELVDEHNCSECYFYNRSCKVVYKVCANLGVFFREKEIK